MYFQFQYQLFAWLFLGIVVLSGLMAYLLQWKKQTTRRIGDIKLVKALSAGYSSRLFFYRFLVIILAFAAGVLAVMNPRRPGGPGTNTRRGIDVVIALDVSKSMLATDLSPSRLERAKQFIGKLSDEMPDDRLALVLFAGKAYLQMPLTGDHVAARLFVSGASPATVPQQGTVIGEALKMSASAFTVSEQRYKAVVLISDGEDHDESAVKTASDLATQGVMINTVGIGSAEGATITDPATGQLKKDEAGNIVVSKLNEEELKNLAEKTNGVYIHLQGSDEAVAQLKSHLSQINSKAYGDVSQINYTTYYWIFAGLMFVLLLAEYFIPERKRKLAI